MTYKLPLTPAGLANYLPVCRAVKAQAPPIIDTSVHDTYNTLYNSALELRTLRVRKRVGQAGRQQAGVPLAA